VVAAVPQVRAEPGAGPDPTPTQEAAAPAQGTAGASAPQPVQAVWVEYESSFTYFGQTTYYSCDSIEDKVRYILLEAGARPDAKVRASCMQQAGVDAMPHVRITVSMPVVATPELLEQRANDSRRALVKRVRGEDGTRPEDEAPFAAVYRTVEMEGRRHDRIAPGDCELLKHMLSQVLVPIGVRELPGTRLDCVKGMVPIAGVTLRLETLQKAPDPDTPADAKP
jgi:hypothetical protein